MRRDFYYYEKKSPLKGILIALVCLVFAGGGYWYYANYFKTVGQRTDTAQEPVKKPAQITQTHVAAIEGAPTLTGPSGPLAARNDDVITADMTVNTDATSRIAVSITDGGVLRLDHGSSAGIGSTDIQMHSGLIGVTSPVARTVTIAPLHAQVTVQGDAVVEIIQEQILRVVVRSGSARVSLSDDAFAGTVNAGEELVVRPSKAKSDQFTYAALDSKKLDTIFSWEAALSQSAPTAAQPSALAVISIDSSINLSIELQDSGAQLSWKRFTGDGFVEYQILRTEKGDPTYGTTPVLKKFSGKETTSFVDTGATDFAKRYTYRICIVTSATEIFCSDAVQTPERQAPKAEITAPSLNALITQFGISFSWQYAAPDHFKEFRLVRSQTVRQPTYPADGFLASFGKDVAQYTDSSVGESSPGTYYYRLCAVSTDDTVGCSNVVTVADGAMK